MGETSSDSSAPSNGEGAGTRTDDDDNDNDGDGQGGEEKEDGETWVEWIIRTTQVAARAMAKAKIPDWVQEQKRRKWRWAGHVMRRTDMRWSQRMFQWVPGERGRRPAGRPAARWEDSLNQFARSSKFKLTEVAQDREQWSSLEDAYVAFGT